jgi:hypothetical protein
MAKAKRARTAETPKLPSFYLPLRAPVFYSTVFPRRIGSLSHVSPQILRCRTLMRHDGGNTLKFQENRDRVTAPPLNPLECGMVR